LSLSPASATVSAGTYPIGMTLEYIASLSAIDDVDFVVTRWSSLDDTIIGSAVTTIYRISS
jgi:hypothetical protein